MLKIRLALLPKVLTHIVQDRIGIHLVANKYLLDE